MSNLIEIWKDIPGYDGDYQVSNFGRIKSFKQKISRLLKNRLDKNGYETVSLCKKGVIKNSKIHRIVLNAFIGESSLVCNHKNGIKNDNRLCNLEWVSILENTRHGFEKRLNKNIGETHYRTSLSTEQVIEIKRLLSDTDIKQKDIAEQFNVKPNVIRDIKRSKNWKHIK